jgi:hypothetical protein
MPANDFPQTPAYTISHHGYADAAACDKPGPEVSRRPNAQRVENQQVSPLGPAALLYSFELRPMSQTARFRKGETLRGHPIVAALRLTQMPRPPYPGSGETAIRPQEQYRKIFPRKKFRGKIQPMNVFIVPVKQAGNRYSASRAVPLQDFVYGVGDAASAGVMAGDSIGLIAGDSAGLIAGDSAGLMAGDSIGLVAGDSAALMVASGEAVGLSAGLMVSVFC